VVAPRKWRDDRKADHPIRHGKEASAGLCLISGANGLMSLLSRL
jgi:hypothetical protein